MADKEVRLIDKDKLIEKINAEIDAWGKARMCMTADELLETIEEFEEEAQPVKHGRWINLTPPEWRESFRKHWAGCINWMCSECKSAVAFLSEDMPYDLCPNCGARMDGGSE